MPHEEAGEAGSGGGGGGGVVPGTRRVKLRDVNAHLACVLCGGYLVDATTIVECLHSFCRSCIIKYLETNNFCPICDVQIHKAKPFLNIKPDKTLQDIVYKLVPGLFQAEMRRRREFYSQHPEQVALTTPEERGVGVERIIYSPEDSISLSLEYYESGRPSPGADDGETNGAGGGAARNSAPVPSVVATADPHEQKPQSNGDVTNGSAPPPPGLPPSVPLARNIPHKRYLRCPAVVTIGHLKKFLRLKFDLSAAYRVDVIHRGVCLPEDYTLMDVAYIYTWKRSEPMEFMYRIHEPPRPTIRRKRRPAPEAHTKEVTPIPEKVNGETVSQIVSENSNADQDSSDDPPPPKLERMADCPVAKEGTALDTDQDTLPPPTIDRPEEESASEEQEKKVEEIEKKEEKEAAVPKEEQPKAEEEREKAAPIKESASATPKEKMAEAEMPSSPKSARLDARGKAESARHSEPTPKKAVEAPHTVQTPLARPHSTPGAAAATPPAATRPHHPQQQQLPSPRPASSPPALVAQQTQASAGDGRKDAAQTPALPKEAAATEPKSSAKTDEASSQPSTAHPERKRSRESEEDEASAAKRDRNGALDLSGGSSRLSGDSSPPPASPSSSPNVGRPPSSSTPQKDVSDNATAALIVPSGRVTPATTSVCSKSPALPQSATNSSPSSESIAPTTQSKTSTSTNPTPANSTPSNTPAPDNASKTTNISAQANTPTTASTASNNSNTTTILVSSNNSSITNTPKLTITATSLNTSTISSVNYSANPTITTNTSTTTIASNTEATPRVCTSAANGLPLQPSASSSVTSRQGKATKGQSTQTLQSIAQNLARNAQQKQLQQQQQQQQQQKILQKAQQSPQQQQKPLQHVPPLQTPKYTPQTKLQQQLQQQTHHQLMQQHIQQQNQQHFQQHAQLLRQQQIQQMQQNQQQNLRNHQASKQTATQSKFPNTTIPSSTASSSSPPVTITISTKTSPARQSSPMNRTSASPVNAVSPQNKSSGLTLSLGQLNHHNSSANNRPSPKRGAPPVSNNNNFLKNNNLHHHHHLPHISISQHSNNGGSTSPASATSPGYPGPPLPLSSMLPFPIRTGSLRSPPPPLAPPPPPPPPSHHNSHPGAALRIPVPPTGKPRPSSLSSSSPSPSPPGDQHSSTPSPNGHASLAHQKASPNGSPGLAGRHDHFVPHHLHSGALSPHGLRLRQQMEMQSRHLAEQHLQQTAHQQTTSASPVVAAAAAAAAANPQILQQWHQLHQLHLRHQQQQQQTANASQSAAAMSAGGYPMDWYSYPSSVKLLEYFMKLGHLPMFPYNNNTTSANNNSTGSAGTRK